MSISGSRWSFKTSVINRFIRSLNTALFIYTDELVQNVLGITVRQYEIRSWLTRCHPGIIPLPSHQIFSIIFRRLFSIGYIRTFPWSVNNRHHIILFEVHVHLPHPLDPVGCINKFFDFYFTSNIIFSFVSNIQSHTMKWLWNTPLTPMTYLSSFNNSRRKQFTDMYSLFATTLIKRVMLS